MPKYCLCRNMASTSTATTMKTSWSPLIYALEKPKFWFLRKQTETLTAKALLTGLILQQRVLLLLRSDATNQLIAGTVQAINKFLNTRQIHTGGYNPEEMPLLSVSCKL